MIAASWLTPEIVRTLGWTLVHFVWEGAALALVLYVFLAFTRTARIRYAAGVITLVLMGLTAVVTFSLLRNETQSLETSSAHQVITSLQVAAKLAIDTSVGTVRAPLPPIDWLSCLVWAWFGGVLIFGLRALGGWLLLERLHHETREPLSGTLVARCLQLQDRLGVTRTVRYVHSRLVDAPAVMGWFRPIVLIPIAALTGLSSEQLEAVIAHELAHIKRLDCFVNLFQITVETVLFYHPAVWWVSRLIRTERENCCDDVAVSVCGNPGDYARALTVMEGWRMTPALVLAVNSGSLRSRVGRLLGVEAITRSIPRGGLAAIGVLCAAGALFATTTANGVFTNISETDATESERLPDPPPAPPVPAIAYSFSSPCQRATRAARIERTATLIASVAGGSEVYAEIAQAARADSKEPSSSGESYIGGLQAAGVKDLTVDQIIALKTQGITPDYVREMRAAGLDTSVDNLIGMKVQGITPDYIKGIHAAGLNPSTHDLIALKVQGVTPEYVSKIRAQYGNDVTVHQIIAMKVQGIDPSQAAEFRRLGLPDISLNQLIALKVQGVTPDYVRRLQAAGFKDLKTSEILAAKVQGITSGFIQDVRNHGFTNLNIRQLIQLKISGIF